MFDSFREDINTYKYNTAELEKISSNVLEEIKWQNGTVESWQKLLTNEDLLKEMVIGSAISSIEKKATQILLDEAKAAVKSNPEFSKSAIFWTKLQEAILNEDTIFVEAIGQENIKVTIDLDKTAGTLNDYVDGVLYAREQLEGEYPRKKEFDPKKASQKWKQIYEAGGTFYNKIITWRIETFGKKAPFWKIINDGTPKKLGGVDRGGTPYPVSKPTRFKQRAEQKISDLIAEEIKSQRRNWKASAREGMSYARRNVEILTEIYREASIAILESAPNFKIAENKLVTQLDKFGEDRLNKADPRKLNALIAGISSGKADPTKRHYLQRPGEKPFKVRIRDITRKFNEEIDKG